MAPSAVFASGSIGVPQTRRVCRGGTSTQLSMARKHPDFADLEPDAFSLCRPPKHTTLSRGATHLPKGDPHAAWLAVIFRHREDHISHLNGRNAIRESDCAARSLVKSLSSTVSHAPPTPPPNTNCELFIIARREIHSFLRTSRPGRMKLSDCCVRALRWTHRSGLTVILQNLPGRLQRLAFACRETQARNRRADYCVTSMKFTRWSGMTRESIKTRSCGPGAARTWVRLKHGAMRRGAVSPQALSGTA